MSTKVPRVIQEIERAVSVVSRDVKPVAKLMGKLFLGAWLGDPAKLAQMEKIAKHVKNASAFEPGCQHLGFQKCCDSCREERRKARAAHNAPQASQVIEAEFIDERSKR
jgi:hypothetical protein